MPEKTGLQLFFKNIHFACPISRAVPEYVREALHVTRHPNRFF
jgi:hypothetical protein